MNTVYRLEGEQGRRKALILLRSFYREEEPAHIRFEWALRPPLIRFSSFTAEEGNEVDRCWLLESHVSNLSCAFSLYLTADTSHLN